MKYDLLSYYVIKCIIQTIIDHKEAFNIKNTKLFLILVDIICRYSSIFPYVNFSINYRTSSILLKYNNNNNIFIQQTNKTCFKFDFYLLFMMKVQLF